MLASPPAPSALNPADELGEADAVAVHVPQRGRGVALARQARLQLLEDAADLDGGEGDALDAVASKGVVLALDLQHELEAHVVIALPWRTAPQLRRRSVG